MGRNGVGKTNILQGIEQLAETASNLEGTFQESLDLMGELVFCVRGIQFRYAIKNIVFPKENEYEELDFYGLEEKLERQDISGVWHSVLSRSGQIVLGKEGESLVEINQSMPMLPAIVAMTPNDFTKDEIFPVLAYFRAFKYYAFDENKDDPNSFRRSEYLKWLTSSGEKHDSVIKRLLHMYLNRKGDFDELNEILGVNGLGVIHSIAINQTGSKDQINYSNKSMQKSNLSGEDNIIYFVYFNPGNGWENVDFLPKLPFSKLSAGTRRIIRILVSFFYDCNSLFLFEQPEDAIHPGLLRKLIDILRGYDDKGQLIMTSHSSDLFDVLRPEEVQLVTMQGGETQVRGLTESELAGAKRYINEEGSLSDYLEMLEDY